MLFRLAMPKVLYIPKTDADNLFSDYFHPPMLFYFNYYFFLPFFSSVYSHTFIDYMSYLGIDGKAHQICTVFLKPEAR